MQRWLIDRAGVKITVRAKSGAAEKLIKVALAGMRPKNISKAQGIKLTVSGEEGDWKLRDHHSDLRRKLANPGDLIYHLTDRIVFHIADKAAEKHCLHAAAVSYKGRALVIPANSGAGKSSFTTWLVANGLDYITDELILVDKNLHIDGLGRPIQIKAHGIDAVQSQLSSVDDIYKGKLANAVPVSSLGGEVSGLAEHPLGLLVFPQYKKDLDYSFTKLTSADAGMRLMANHVNARNLEGHGFRAMMEMIRNTPCYALEYGGFNKLPDDFSTQLKALVEPD